MKLTPYVEYLLADAFSELRDVEVKRMFGGYGFYLDARIFGFTIDDDRLVFKVDDSNRQKYIDAGSEQFVYTGHKNKGPVGMPYWTVPEGVIENPGELASWATESAALSKTK